MTKPLAETSPSTRGRILAALYLVVIIGGITAQAFISDRLVVCDDAAKTATNILANTSLYRLGFTIFMLEMVAQVVVSAMYYDLLKRISGTSRCFFELSGATNSTIGSYQIDYVNFRPNRATEWDSTPKRCSRASSLDAPLLGEGTTFLGGPAGAGVVFRLRVSDTSPPTVGPVTPYNIESGDFVDSPFDLTTSVTDNESPVISCQYTTDGGSTWNPATVSGSTPNFTCTKTGITGTTGQVLTLNMRATSAGGTSTGTVVIRTVDQAPVARGRNVTVPVVSSCTANASVDDGSFDPDGDPITISQSPPEPYPLCQTSVTLTVTDSKGISSQSIGKVTAVDAALPQVSGGASKTTLWPPNHHLIDVRFSYAAKDNCDANPAASISVTSDEPGVSSPQAAFIKDASGKITGLRLRAERNGDGRVYLIKVTATDKAGNSASTCAAVTVPHDQSAASRSRAAARAAAAVAACEPLANNALAGADTSDASKASDP